MVVVTFGWGLVLVLADFVVVFCGVCNNMFKLMKARCTVLTI